MPSQPIATSALIDGGVFAGRGLAEADGDVAVVLFDRDTMPVGDDAVRAKRGERRAVECHMQPAAMNAELGIGIAGEFAAWLLVEELAEAVEETAFDIFDGKRLDLGQQTERVDLARRMWQ